MVKFTPRPLHPAGKNPDFVWGRLNRSEIFGEEKNFAPPALDPRTFKSVA